MKELFKTEISRIENENLKKFTEAYLEHYVPQYFWTIGASVSGLYHPQFAQGNGGLVRHTKAVCMFAEELLRMSNYAYMNDIYKDYVRVACIVHDTCKYGKKEFDKSVYKDHSKLASENVNEAWCDYFKEDAPQYLLDAIRTHMGQWSEKENRPFTSIDRCVHMADYMASRPFIDIPKITEDYNFSLTSMADDVIMYLESEVNDNE